MKWVFVQFDSRREYLLPRYLARSGRLISLYTDAYRSTLIARLYSLFGSKVVVKKLYERHHKELDGVPVVSGGVVLLMFDAICKMVLRTEEKKLNYMRNRLLGYLLARPLKRLARQHGDQLVVGFYSYSLGLLANDLRKLGVKLVCFQFDPGREEERLVSILERKYLGGLVSSEYPSVYWKNWKAELESSDLVVCNSIWTKELVERYYPQCKMTVQHLLTDSYAHPRKRSLLRGKPLRLLFLGRVEVRKGVVELLEAVRKLGELVRLDIVGGLVQPALNLESPNVTVHGAVPRSEVVRFYNNADVFLFPTHSDGFGMTQLEALGCGVPVIASKNCARVVDHMSNGYLLESVTVEEIEKAIRWFLCEESQGERFSAIGVPISLNSNLISQQVAEIENTLSI